jgi:AcrR family transcriptional regulator
MNEIQRMSRGPLQETPVSSPPVLDRGRRTERAKAARREDILAAARRVFASRGFRGTTIADIADDAGIALGTIYLYFPSKEGVFAALNARLGELIAEAGRIAEVGPSLADTVRHRVEHVFAACALNRDLVRLVVLNTDPGTEIQRRIKDADEVRNRPIAREIAHGVERATIRACDPVVAARLIQGLISMAVYQAFVLGNDEEADAFRDACADMIIAYLQPVVGTSSDGSPGR